MGCMSSITIDEKLPAIDHSDYDYQVKKWRKSLPAPNTTSMRHCYQGECIWIWEHIGQEFEWCKWRGQHWISQNERHVIKTQITIQRLKITSTTDATKLSREKSCLKQCKDSLYKISECNQISSLFFFPTLLLAILAFWWYVFSSLAVAAFFCLIYLSLLCAEWSKKTEW